MPLRRYKWLINLRWIAAGGVLLAGFLVHLVFKLPIPVLPVFLIGILLLLSNILYLYFYNNISADPETAFPKHIRLVIIQIISDLILLTLLLHYSGGVENPFMIYYIFHMMLAGILLPRKVSLLLTSFALSLVGLMAIGESAGWFPHYALQGFLAVCFYDNPVYLIGTGFVFVTTS